jgi:hypothetical protein
MGRYLKWINSSSVIIVDIISSSFPPLYLFKFYFHIPKLTAVYSNWGGYGYGFGAWWGAVVAVVRNKITSSFLIVILALLFFRRSLTIHAIVELHLTILISAGCRPVHLLRD